MCLHNAILVSEANLDGLPYQHHNMIRCAFQGFGIESLTGIPSSQDCAQCLSSLLVLISNQADWGITGSNGSPLECLLLPIITDDHIGLELHTAVETRVRRARLSYRSLISSFVWSTRYTTHPGRSLPLHLDTEGHRLLLTGQCWQSVPYPCSSTSDSLAPLFHQFHCLNSIFGSTYLDIGIDIA